MNKQSSVYIMTNKHRTVLYIGATNNLPARIKSHKNGMADGFSNKYCCHYLVHVELYDEWLTAINRERQLKKMEAGLEV